MSERERATKTKADCLVVVRGGGDLGTGVAHRLARSGYRVAVLETARPLVVRRAAAFAEAVPSGRVVVEGIEARCVEPDALDATPASDGAGGEPPSRAGWPDWVPVVVDPDGVSIARLGPDAIVDARMRKRPPERPGTAGVLSIGLGPGFTAGRDADLVVETARGNSLGALIERGAALADTGVPGPVLGHAGDRVVRAPGEGIFEASRAIGDLVQEGDVVGRVGELPVRATIAGLLRGLIHDGARVRQGTKIGDVDPRGAAIDPAAISDKARAIGGAVLEALLSRGLYPGGRTYGE